MRSALNRQASVQKETARRVIEALAAQRREDRRNGLSPTFLALKKRQAQQEDRMARLAGY